MSTTRVCTGVQASAQNAADADGEAGQLAGGHMDNENIKRMLELLCNEVRAHTSPVGALCASRGVFDVCQPLDLCAVGTP